MADCPKCGSAAWTDPGPCDVCGHSEFVPLSFRSGTGQERKLGRLALSVGSVWARWLGEDARYWDSDFQMRFEPTDEGWTVTPNPDAPNETLLDGRCILECTQLANGMVLGVGREAKNIVKTPMQVVLG